MDLGSDGQGGLWAMAAAECAGNLCSAAAHDGGSPEFAKSGTPGVNSTRARVRGVLHAMRDRSRVLFGHVEACNGERVYGCGPA